MKMDYSAFGFRYGPASEGRGVYHSPDKGTGSGENQETSHTEVRGDPHFGMYTVEVKGPAPAQVRTPYKPRPAEAKAETKYVPPVSVCPP